MTRRHLNKASRPPLWAVLGAPLIGVPVMVGLLALGAPKTQAPPTETMPSFVAEPVDTHVVEPQPNDSARQLEQELRAG